jgi:serine/threonine-protein kinase HipA
MKSPSSWNATTASVPKQASVACIRKISARHSGFCLPANTRTKAAVAYDWLIVGTDAHAKNYALLIGAKARVRLAPLYDLASVLPYSEIDIQRVKLSMKLGGEYRFRDIRLRHWRGQAEELGVDPDELVPRVNDLANQLADHITDVERSMTEEGLTHPLIHRLAARLTARAKACRRVLGSR